jgi:DNA-binding response OmpR family regulator
MTEQRRKRVLIVDNDADILEIMTEALSHEGYEVTGFIETGDIFLLIDQHKPDIIILDYVLNGINGGTICKQIKINEKTAGLPVVIMSAHTRVLQSASYYRCNVFIPKPFDLWHFVDCVGELIAYSSYDGGKTS